MSTQDPGTLDREAVSRRKYIISAIIGAILALGWFLFAWFGLDGRYFVIVDRYLDLGDRLAYVAKWMMGPALCLLTSVDMVAWSTTDALSAAFA